MARHRLKPTPTSTKPAPRVKKSDLDTHLILNFVPMGYSAGAPEPATTAQRQPGSRDSTGDADADQPADAVGDGCGSETKRHLPRAGEKHTSSGKQGDGRADRDQPQGT
jgi:hypothetical protein